MTHRLRLLALILLASATQASAQNDTLPRDVFVMVDVSGSMVGAKYGIGFSKVQEAQNLVRDLLTDQFDWSRYSNWQHSLVVEQLLAITRQDRNRRPLLSNGSRLFLKRFGDPATSKAPSVERLIGNNLRADVNALFSSFPRQADFDDQRTFLWLARAMTRREAMAGGLTSYLLIEITDAREDKENIVDPTDQVAVREFKSIQHVKSNGEIGSFTHKQTRGEYVLQINARLVRLTGDPGASAASGQGALLGSLKLPQDLREGDTATVSWDSFNASGGLTYTATLQAPVGPELVQTTAAQSVSFPNLKQGEHTITVSAPGSSALTGKFQVLAANAPVPTPADDGAATILLQSPRRDAEILSGSVSVSWRVINPPPGCRYLVTVTGPPGAPKIPKKTVDGTRASFSVRKAGPYRVRVAATARGVKPAAGTFTVKNNAGNKALVGLSVLLLVGILTGIGINHARKRRDGKEGDFGDYVDDLD